MKFALATAGAALALASSPALALGDETDLKGEIQLKLLATAVLPDGSIDEINVNVPGLPAMSMSPMGSLLEPSLFRTACCFLRRSPVKGTSILVA